MQAGAENGGCARVTNTDPSTPFSRLRFRIRFRDSVFAKLRQTEKKDQRWVMLIDARSSAAQSQSGDAEADYKDQREEEVVGHRMRPSRRVFQVLAHPQ